MSGARKEAWLMKITDIIIRKRDGGALDGEEIRFFVRGCVSGEIPDYQTSALLMAIFLKGMNARETKDLTLAMADSGSRLDLSGIRGIKVDKHSTGGIGDKTTLVVGPMAAAAGVPVAKMSGRALGYDGGTIDKLESIPGFCVNLTTEQFVNNVNRVGFAVSAQTAELAPADKKLYALRDVTGTVESLPLIASSIMSKKIATGADALVLDVKCGSGAYMKTYEGARALAKAMTDIGELAGLPAAALITDMSQPLGYAVGNALEVKEAIQTLQGHGPKDLEDIALSLGSYMAFLAGIAENPQAAREKLRQTLLDGSAFRKFCEFVDAQGGDVSCVKEPAGLPQAARVIPVLARSAGYVASIQAEEIGRASMELGAGRKKASDSVDSAVGVVLCKKIGEHVSTGEPLAFLHCGAEGNPAEQGEHVLESFQIDTVCPQSPPRVREVIANHLCGL